MSVPWSPLACLRERLRQEVRAACLEWEVDPDKLTDAEVDELIGVIASMPDEAEDDPDLYREGLRRYEQLRAEKAA